MVPTLGFPSPPSHTRFPVHDTPKAFSFPAPWYAMVGWSISCTSTWCTASESARLDGEPENRGEGNWEATLKRPAPFSPFTRGELTPLPDVPAPLCSA